VKGFPPWPSFETRGLATALLRTRPKQSAIPED